VQAWPGLHPGQHQACLALPCLALPDWAYLNRTRPRHAHTRTHARKVHQRNTVAHLSRQGKARQDKARQETNEITGWVWPRPGFVAGPPFANPFATHHHDKTHPGCVLHQMTIEESRIVAARMINTTGTLERLTRRGTMNKLWTSNMTLSYMRLLFDVELRGTGSGYSPRSRYHPGPSPSRTWFNIAA
jgi:hypothetical protein